MCGGTITGCATVLRKRNPNLKVFAIEPSSSAVLSGKDPGPHSIQGIGAGFIPKVLDTSLIDEVIEVDDAKAMEVGRQLARQEGLLSGISSGAAVSAALEIGKRSDMEKKRIVIVLPSFGERYLSTSMFTNLSSFQPRKDGYI